MNEHPFVPNVLVNDIKPSFLIVFVKIAQIFRQNIYPLNKF